MKIYLDRSAIALDKIEDDFERASELARQQYPGYQQRLRGTNYWGFKHRNGTAYVLFQDVKPETYDAVINGLRAVKVA